MIIKKGEAKMYYSEEDMLIKQKIPAPDPSYWEVIMEDTHYEKDFIVKIYRKLKKVFS